MPTPATEDLSRKSVLAPADHYGADLTAVSSQSLAIDNRDFDTGLETKAGEYSLTDRTYADWLETLADQHFAQVTPELQANVLAFYGNAPPPAFAAKSPRK